jgi:uncharacterized membrane protein
MAYFPGPENGSSKVSIISDHLPSIGTVLAIVHILSFVAAFAFTEGLAILLRGIATKHNPSIVEAMFLRGRRFSAVGGTLWLATAVSGMVLAWHLDISLSSVWVTWSLVLFAVLFLTGILVHARWENLVLRAAQRALNTGSEEELRRLSAAPWKRVGQFVSAVCIIAITALMVAKPESFF